jgi:hypothetical protein
MWRGVFFVLLSVLRLHSRGSDHPQLFVTGRSNVLPPDILKWWVIPRRWEETETDQEIREILLTGTLLTGPLIDQWNSGYGKVLVESTWQPCLYMTNTGTLSGNPMVLHHFEPF